jgi:NADPH2:quinone reductase
MFRDGRIKIPLPFAVGVEGASIVDAVGADVSGPKVGDRGAYWSAFGSYADVRLVEADASVKVPNDVSTELTAAILAKGFTAWALLKQVHVVQIISEGIYELRRTA